MTLNDLSDLRVVAGLLLLMLGSGWLAMKAFEYLVRRRKRLHGRRGGKRSSVR